MTHRILTTGITAQNLASLRDRTRQIGELFGLDKLACTRFITAVSEIARNTVQYAGQGSLTFLFQPPSAPSLAQYVVAQISDKGPGIPDLPAVLAGRLNARGQVPMGLAGCRRLADRFKVECPEAGGTFVTIEMALPRSAARLPVSALASLVDQLARRKPRTPLEELEEQNREMLGALEALKDRQAELELADARKNQFVATLAHELRNPLGTLEMTLEILRRRPDMAGAELLGRHEVMARQTRQLTRLVEDLMDVSRVSQGKVELNKQPTEMNDLVRQALEMTSAAIKDKAHEVELTLHTEPLWVEGDSTRLKQVLSNLLHNAARYSAKNGHIAVRVRTAKAHAIVEVSDRGIGIAPELLPHVFGLFVQGQQQVDGVPGGLGVGLTLAQRLVHEHGGTVAAASAGPGYGSQFTVNLPLMQAKA
ncbi:MAG TPA: sensor histidine kinase [Ramlibacter sp.]|nr:sensor histidine kinase [Ramlibacter sp.]